MKKLLLIALIFIANTLSVYPASPADTCTQLNVSAQADDLLTVIMVSISIVEKTGSNQLTISYRQTNNTSDKKLDEGSFALFFADGTAMPQYGFFNYFFPGDSRQRAHTWEYLKSQNPIAISYNPGFFAQAPNAAKLNWAIPGKACQLSVLAEKAAAEKAAAEKAAAEKLALAEAAKKGREESANSALQFLADQVRSTLQDLDLRVKTLIRTGAGNQGRLIELSQSISQLGNVTISNFKDIEREIYDITLRVDAIEDAQTTTTVAKTNVVKKTTINCVKGKLTKKVTGVKPKCPSGYKVKK